MNDRERYETWLKSPYFDEATKEELRGIADDEQEIRERFYQELEFGTAGLRGIMGAGTNRMNIYTVRKATQGLANYILKNKGQERGVVIAYDSRHHSSEFADEAARCLCANQIKTYVFPSLRPTPELSFAVRALHCMAGINITASHNPPAYNGYKVYWEDGAQITPPHDQGIMEEVSAITDYSTAKTMTAEQAKAAGLYQILGAEMDEQYLNVLKQQVLHQDAIDAVGKDLKIVYTPLHGTGNQPVRKLLRDLGFPNVYVVPEQELPDGDFPTVSYPNPEEKEAFDLGIQLARKVDADLILASDPDADRLGVYVKDEATNTYQALTGNMTGCLLADYEIGQKKALKLLPEDGQLVTSIVSSKMAKAIASAYEVDLKEVLTGFKWIGRQIRQMEDTGKGHFVFGFEESYGYLIGTYARDKDAVGTAMALCEAAAYYRTKGKTLWQVVQDLYETYGYYREQTQSITLQGISGLQKIQEIMETLRENPPQMIGNAHITADRDYLKSTARDRITGEIQKTALPASNVLYYELEDHSWVCVRPSGTEPKIKIYYEVRGQSAADAKQKSQELEQSVQALFQPLL